MTLANQLAKHLRDVHFGGNWSTVDLKNTLSDLTLEEATTKIYSLNSILAITFHMAYYLDVLIGVLEENVLNGKDELSWVFDTPGTEEEWKIFQETIWEKVERVTLLIEKLPDEKLTKEFLDPKYGTYYRNIAGIIEHVHYHLGQVVIIKKLLAHEK
ncbi:DinB family protein [Fluviicola taffensis]|uniref:DinB-like domain-containing protein n=1 Tax=Fluviicola taffensis (strain DSM 16823 / NCIMB 13979 / RW262) TaxID=755732 RepID=F2IGA9_FLUTR|nr:hypothetical protein Fluta_3809 [Fluviicola taffensis DSM 16823]